MLGLKRDYLNSKLNSLDSYISKLREEVKEKTNSRKIMNNLIFHKHYFLTIIFLYFKY